MRMVFNFRMSIEDYHHMMLCRTFGSSWLRRLLMLGSWVVFAGLLIGEVTHVIELGRVVHICALMVTVALPAAFFTMEIDVSKYRDAYKAGFKAERQIVADHDGLTFCNKTTSESGRNSWSDVTRLEEFKHIFVIHINRHEAVILPKRGMGNGKKVEQFKELVIQMIPERFIPLGKSLFR